MSVRKNKGGTFMEVIVAIFIVTITSIACTTGFASAGNSRGTMEEASDGFYKVDAVKKLLICNYSYDEIKDMLKEKELYINNDNLQDLNLYHGTVSESFEPNPLEYPFITIKGEERQGGTLKIYITYHFHRDREIEIVFYKGDYEEVK